MITRRHFNGLMGAAGVTLVSVGQTRGQSTPVVRLGNAAGIIDPQVTFLTVGQNKRTPFYQQEGVELDIINMTSGAQTIQSVTAGNVETTTANPLTLLSIVSKTPNIDLVAVYAWLRQPHFSVGVKPDSPIKTLADLKGKTIGIRNQGDTGYFATRAMLSELGIDPDKDVEWAPIGEGGPAGQAVYSGRVAAMGFWDSAFMRIELAGFPFRYLPNTPTGAHLMSGTYAVRRSDLAKNRDMLVRFFRAMAKSTVFAYANPEAAIKLHYEVYPESKPKGKSDAEAISDAKKINDARKDKWFAGDWDPDKRLGAMTKADWDDNARFLGMADKVGDVSRLFSTELIADVNKFDRAAIEKQAREMKL